MANPNKTVFRYRQKVGFPVREPRDITEFSSRVDAALAGWEKEGWTRVDIEKCIVSGIRPIVTF